MSKYNRYANYTQLIAKVDKSFADIYGRHKQSFSCKSGCFGCCRGDLSVLPVEAEYIRDWLDARSDVKAKISGKTEMKGDPAFCNFLDRQGQCVIYDVRPIICRSHGAPVSWAAEQDNSQPFESRDVCPLNFQEQDIHELEARDVLSLDKLNTLLSLINRQFTQNNSAARVNLSDLV